MTNHPGLVCVPDFTNSVQNKKRCSFCTEVFWANDRNVSGENIFAFFLRAKHLMGISMSAYFFSFVGREREPSLLIIFQKFLTSLRVMEVAFQNHLVSPVFSASCVMCQVNKQIGLLFSEPIVTAPIGNLGQCKCKMQIKTAASSWVAICIP